ncbi:MAG: hypothetical protein IJQ16_06300 [Selenomonadaceae bacterium]|nr:hypothetical protein [Selenomonadaceae bacterium]
MDSEILVQPSGDGGTPPDMPSDGGGGTPPDSNGGGNSSSSSSVSWSGATEITSAGTFESPTYTSTSSGQNAVLVNTSDAVVINNATVTKSGGDSAGDNESFYGTNSAILVKGGSSTTINGGSVQTDAAGANGVFSYGGNGGQNGAAGDGTTIYISNVNITTTGNGSGGIMTTGGGKTVAENLTINTSGGSSAAIRTDRGGGNVTVTGGSYTSNGVGSPAIYSTADIVVNNATLTSTKSEGVCIEGLNSVTLNNCNLTANNTQRNGQATFLDGVMIYQSMSGDSATGTSTFTMTGGTLTNKSGHVFHVTNTSAVINLSGVTINNEDSNGVLLSVSDDGWSGASNVATLNASGQSLSGNILVGSDSTLSLNLSNGATFSGNISGNITNASGDVVSSSVGTVNLTLDDASKLYLNADTYVTAFSGNAANIITNGYNFYVNNSVLSGTTSSEESVPSALIISSAASIISASSTFSGTINLNDYSDLKNVDASATSNDVIVIGNANDNSILGGGGHSSMYGAAGNDTLTGNTARDQFWFMGDGNATVTNFIAGNGDTSDVVTFYNMGLDSVSRAGSQLNFTASTGATFNLQTNSDDSNNIILYSADGQNIYSAKVGNDSDESITYDSSVNFYQLKTNGTLYVTDDAYKEILLDNSAGKFYSGIQNVVANNSGENLIAGNSSSNLIVGGSGNNSLWGGAGGVDDTLQGGSGYNAFWYGQGEGNDSLTNMKQGDVVNLYNINLSDITSAQVDSENVYVTTTSGNTLKVNCSGEVTPTFQLANGEKYAYNRSSGTWQN